MGIRLAGEVCQHIMCFSTKGQMPVLKPEYYFCYWQKKCSSGGMWVKSSFCKVILKKPMLEEESVMI